MTIDPSWGVLAKAPARALTALLSTLVDRFDWFSFRVVSHGEWSAAFYMKPDVTSETDGADALRLAGLDVAQLNFDPGIAGYSVQRWDGQSWAVTGEDPVALCSAVGILVPGQKQLSPPKRPHRPATIRAISLVEGASVEEVENALDGRELPVRVEPSPRGALVTEWELGTYPDISERLPHLVYHLEYSPDDGRFVCLTLRDGETTSAFTVGDTWVLPGVPSVPHVEGQTNPQDVVRALGVPDSFLARRQ